MSQVFPPRDLETLNFINNMEFFNKNYNDEEISKDLIKLQSIKKMILLSKIYEKRNGLLLIKTFSTSGSYQGRNFLE